MKFLDLSADFLKKIGIDDSSTEDDGVLSLLFDDEHEIQFVVDKVDHALFLYCELADTVALGEQAYQSLLESSLLGAKTGGAGFAINAALEKLVLWKRFTDSFEDCSDLESITNDFLSQVIFWKDKIRQLQGLADPDDKNKTAAENVKAEYENIPVSGLV